VLIFFGWHYAGARSSVENSGVKENTVAQRRIARDHASTDTVDAAPPNLPSACRVEKRGNQR
jgi:hypothetical protein